MKSGDSETKTGGFSLWRLLPSGFIGLGVALFFAVGLDDTLSHEALARHRLAILDWTAANYVLAVAGFVGAYYATVMFSVPGATWMTLAGGFLFGTVEATVYVVVGATGGAVAVFLAARLGVGDAMRRRAGPTMRKMEAGFRENALSYLLVLRLVPLFPFWLVNLVPAFLGVPLRTYAVGTFFGIIPGSFVYASVGNGLGAAFELGEAPGLGTFLVPEIMFPIAGLAVLSLVPVVYKLVRARRA